MPKHRSITEVAAKRFKHPDSGQIDHFDQTYPGLHLRVGKRLKTWGYATRFNGKPIRLTLDNFPPMSVLEAHEEWRRLRDMIRKGEDPRGDRAPVHFGGVVEEWFKRDQAENRSVGQVRYRIEKHVLPYWRDRDINSIKRRDVLDLVDAIMDRGTPIMANRVHAHLQTFFNWCVRRGIVEVNPMTGLAKPAKETKRERVLADDELLKVWTAAESLGYPYGPAVHLLILTGARLNEIGALRWDEIKDGVIELEGARTKNGEPHTIPLSTPARTILENLPRIQGEVVFTMDGERPASDWSRAKRRLDEVCAVTAWRIHDLRRTVATGLQKLGTPLQVTEAVLGHTGGSRAGIVGVYQRHDYASEKRSALEAWGAHVTELVEGREPGKVLPMRGAQ